MKLFAVYLNTNFDIRKAVFITEGFSYQAFLFHIFWALYNFLWEATAVFLLLMGIVFYAHDLYLISSNTMLIMNLLVMIYAGISGNDWKQLACWRRGLKLNQVIMAKDIEEAQLLFYRAINLENPEVLERKLAT